MNKARFSVRHGFHLALAAAALSVLGSLSPAFATDLFWDGDGVGPQAGGAGTWNTTTAHFATSAGNATVGTTWVNATNVGDTAVFNGTAGTQNVTLAGPISVNTIRTTVSGYIIGNGNGNIASANRLQFQGSSGTVDVQQASGSTQLTAFLDGQTLTKIGVGRLELNNSGNSSTNKFIMKAGSLTAPAPSRYGAPATLVSDFFTFDGGGLGGNTTLAYDMGVNRGVTITSNGAFFGVTSATVILTFGAPVVGAGGITIYGGAAQFTGSAHTSAPTVILSNTTNSYAGPNIIGGTGVGGAGATLVATHLDIGGNNSSIGSSSNAAANLVFNQGTLRYTGAGDSTDRNFTLAVGSTSGTLDGSGTGAVVFNGGGTVASSGSGARTLTLRGTSAAAINNSFGLVLNDGTGGATSVTKTDANTWVMTNANGYTGTTTITTGTLLAGNDTALGASTISLNGGALGTSGGARTLANTTKLTVSSSVTPTNNLALNGTFTAVSGANRVLTGTTNTGTTTLGGSVFLSDSAVTAGTLILAGVTSSNPVFTVSGNVANFNGSGLAGNIQVGNGTTASAATLTLSGTNTHTGNTSLSTASLLNIGSVGAFGPSTFNIVGNGSFDNTTGGNLVLATNMTQTNGSPTFVGTDDLTLGNIAISAANRSITITAKTLTVSDITQDLGARTYTKNGAGTLVIMGTGSYLGATTISAGTLQLGNGGAGGALATASAINFTIGPGNLTINQNDAVVQGVDFSGAAIAQTTGVGSLTQAGSGTTTLTAANTYTGATTISNGILQLGNGGATGTLASAGTIVNNANLTFNHSNAMTQGTNFSTAAITGSGSVTQAGSGTTTMTANSYLGNTTVSGGTLLANNAAGTSATGSGNVTVQTGATLGGTGSVSGSVTVDAGGTLSPGTSIESLGTGSLTFGATGTAGATLKFEIGAGGAADLVNAALGSLTIADPTLTVGATLSRSSGPFVPAGSKYTVIAYNGNWVGGFSFKNAQNNTLVELAAREFLIKYQDTTPGGNFYLTETQPGSPNITADSRFVTLTAVPELGSFLTMGLIGFCALGAVRLGKRYGFKALSL